MKYTTEIEINAPVEKVAVLLGDHGEMKKWMRELESYEPISGNPKQPGSKTRMKVNVGKEMEIIETVLATEFPNRFTTRYEMTGGSLVADSKLKATGNGSTIYALEHNFHFTGVLKIATAFMKPAFINHSMRMMTDFKKLAEK